MGTFPILANVIERGAAGEPSCMDPKRRDLSKLAVAVAIAALTPGCASMRIDGEPQMHGLIGKMTSIPGKRDELIAILLRGTADLPGCLSYVIARDPQDRDAIWV